MGEDIDLHSDARTSRGCEFESGIWSLTGRGPSLTVCFAWCPRSVGHGGDAGRGPDSVMLPICAPKTAATVKSQNQCFFSARALPLQ